MSNFRAIIMKPNDTVCTVVEEIAAGTDVTAEYGDSKQTIRATESIPAGHKFAIIAMKTGDPVLKYGEIIGRATKDIAVGQYVHVHNIESCRGRGDK